MFGPKIISHVKQLMPELQNLQILVGGHALNIDTYELINALLIQNNVLDDSKKNIAIFHPKSDLLDVFILIIMGIAAYKDALLRNSRLKVKDFEVGELVEFRGKIVRFGGITNDNPDKIEKFQVIYGDKYEVYPSTSEILMEHFHEVNKYNGGKISPDLSGTQRNADNTRNSLKELLGEELGAGLSGYPTFLVSSDQSRLIDLLKEVTINGTPFFDMFPSVKCTPGNRWRLGRDRIQRSFMFYFVSTLSTADDVLHSEPQIKTLFVDARGKSLNDSTLLSSIRNQYDLEDIYWMQTYEKIDSIEKLENGLGFQIWIWSKEDFARISKTNSEQKYAGKLLKDDYALMAEDHNSTVGRIAHYADVPEEISYPEGLTIELHDQLQKNVRNLFSSSDEYGNPDMQKISIRIAGIVNRIFQSPLPTNTVDEIASQSEKNTFAQDIQSLRESVSSFFISPIPDSFKTSTIEILNILESVIKDYSNYQAKSEHIVAITKENPDKKICVLVNQKYSYLTSALKERVKSKLNSIGYGWLANNLTVVDSPSLVPQGSNVSIWTFKPSVKESLMLDSSVGRNIVLLYPQQKKEFELSLQTNTRRLRKYLESKYRTDILKVPVEMLESASIAAPTVDFATMEDFDLEKVVAATMEKMLPSYKDFDRSNLVDARMVIFSDGTHALFQPGNKIKIVNFDDKTVETKTVAGLDGGDQIAFLRDSKRTVFEELVEYYQHKPEIVELINMSELWRKALLDFKKQKYLHIIKLKAILDEAGLVRHIATIENWLDGTTICPDGDNYAPLDIICKVTQNENLIQNIEHVKEAARKMHALRIRIGRYMAMKLTQSYISPDSIIDDPVLRDKLDEMSSHVRIAQVEAVHGESVQVPSDITNKLLTEEDI